MEPNHSRYFLFPDEIFLEKIHIHFLRNLAQKGFLIIISENRPEKYFNCTDQFITD